MKLFSGMFAVRGTVRKITFEAECLEEARELAARWGVGVEGETAAANSATPEAYDLKTTCRLLGGVSASTIYREIAVGRLHRVAGSRRILITRESIEKRCRSR